MSVVIKFLLFEILNILFLSISNVIRNKSFEEVTGRIKGIIAVYNGYDDYNTWLIDN